MSRKHRNASNYWTLFKSNFGFTHFSCGFSCMYRNLAKRTVNSKNSEILAEEYELLTLNESSLNKILSVLTSPWVIPSSWRKAKALTNCHAINFISLIRNGCQLLCFWKFKREKSELNNSNSEELKLQLGLTKKEPILVPSFGRTMHIWSL